jgi:bacillolysin
LGSTPGKVTIRAIQLGDAKFTGATSDVIFCISPATPRLTENTTAVVASGGSLYQFFVNNNPIGGQTTNTTLIKDFGGVYTVKNVTADGCFSAASNSISATVLSNEPVIGQLVKVAPNPVEDHVNLILPEGEKLIWMEILDNTGKLLKKTTKSTENIKAWSSGQYLLKVKTNQEVYSLKILKK